MRIKTSAKNLTVTFTGICNESMLDDVTFAANQSGCTYKQEDYSTKVIVTGKDLKRLNKFIKLYNER